MTHPLNTNPPPTEPSASVGARREQHGCLVIWLIGMVLFGIFSAYQWTTIMPQLEQLYPTWLVYTALGLMLLEISAAVGVLTRKRWSVYLLVAALLASFILRAVMGILSETSLVALGLSAIILWSFIRPNWRYYT